MKGIGTGCEFKVPGDKLCGKPAGEKYLGLWACQDCITEFNAMWQKVGELGIPVRSSDPEKEIPVPIAKEIDKGKAKKYDQEFLQGCRIEPL